MTFFDSGVAVTEFSSVPGAPFARVSVSNSAILTTATLDGKYNPKMVERLLRAKKGPFKKAPAGEAAFMKWLVHS